MLLGCVIHRCSHDGEEGHSCKRFVDEGKHFPSGVDDGFCFFIVWVEAVQPCVETYRSNSCKGKQRVINACELPVNIIAISSYCNIYILRM